MKSQFLQIRVSEELKDRLEAIAKRYEISMTTLARFVLAEFSNQANTLQLTPNGFTVAEEKRILHSWKQTQEEIKKGKTKTYSSADTLLKSLKKPV